MSWKPRQSGFESRFIELAGYINAEMPRHVVERVAEALNSQGRSVNGSRVHLFGMAYKPNVGDVRESPAIDVAMLLNERGATISYTDSFVPTIREGPLQLDGIPCDVALERGIDCAVIITDHKGVDYVDMARSFPTIVDTRNALRGVPGDHIFRLWK